VTEQVDIDNDYFSQTKRNCLIHSWLTVSVVFAYVCIVAYLLDIIKKAHSTSTTYYSPST